MLVRLSAHSNVYIPGNSKARWFFHRSGLTCFFCHYEFVVRLKARSDEPKYSLLTHVKSKKTFGIFLGVYQYFLAFSGELPA